MIALSPEAEAQLDGLIAHYEALGRVEASINLLNALEQARMRISERPDAGLPAPRPYPALAKAGRRWLIEGSYWISYSLTTPPVISGVFYAMATFPTGFDLIGADDLSFPNNKVAQIMQTVRKLGGAHGDDDGWTLTSLLRRFGSKITPAAFGSRHQRLGSVGCASKTLFAAK